MKTHPLEQPMTLGEVKDVEEDCIWGDWIDSATVMRLIFTLRSLLQATHFEPAEPGEERSWN